MATTRRMGCPGVAIVAWMREGPDQLPAATITGIGPGAVVSTQIVRGAVGVGATGEAQPTVNATSQHHRRMTQGA